MTLPGFSNLLECLTGFAETCTYIDRLIIKDMVKGTDGQPGAEAHGVRPRRVLGTGACVPALWEAPPSWHLDVLTDPGDVLGGVSRQA